MASLEEINLNDINTELKNILKRNGELSSESENVKFCNGNNFYSCLSFITNSLDELGISPFTIPENIVDFESCQNVLSNIINSCYELIKTNKRTMNDLKKAQILNNCHIKELKKSKECIKKSKETNEEMDKEIKKLKNIHDKQTYNIQNTKKDMDKCKQSLNFHRKSYSSKENHLKHKIQRQEEDNKKLNDRFRKSCGKYTSLDEDAAQTLYQYQKNEEKYKNIICNMESNNKQLVEEIIKLKEELILKSLDTDKIK